MTRVYAAGNSSWIAAVTLFVLNSWIAWRLYLLDYSIHTGSVEGAFISLARYLRDHWRTLDWWPVWFCGMPFTNTYAPLFHTLVAAVSGIAGLNIGRAYHLVSGAAYAAGPSTLFCLVLRLTRRRTAAFAAGLAYSLISPSLFLFPSIREDAGGALFARRLQAMVVYGDAPHSLALTLVPLALLLVDRARVSKSAISFSLAAAGCGAVMLANIPGTIVLVIALAAYCATYGALRLVSGICVTGYLLGAWWNPPASLWNTFSNARWMEPDGRIDGQRIAMFAVLMVLAAALTWALRKAKAPREVVFGALFTLGTGAVVCGFGWFGVTLVSQPMRFHLAFEMAICAAAAIAAFHYIRPTRRVGAAILMLATIAVVTQIHNYRLSARRLIQRLDMTTTSEHRVARWLDANAGGARVLAPGSMAFWLNAFTDTPQVTGCCDQGLLLRSAKMAYYVIGSDDGAGENAADISIAWLQMLGARFVVAPGAESTEAFRDLAHPEKFAGRLREAWRGGGDVIYEVPTSEAGLIHVVDAGELVSEAPENGVKIASLQPYLRAINGAGRPAARVKWSSAERARISTTLAPRQVVSIQVPWHRGWHAWVNGESRTVSKDALGFMVVRPECSGPCSIDLEYAGEPERPLVRTATAAAWALVLFAAGRALVMRRRFARER